METRQDKNDEKQKENEKDEKKTYKENGRFDTTTWIDNITLISIFHLF